MEVVFDFMCLTYLTWHNVPPSLPHVAPYHYGLTLPEASCVQGWGLRKWFGPGAAVCAAGWWSLMGEGGPWRHDEYGLPLGSTPSSWLPVHHDTSSFLCQPLPQAFSAWAQSNQNCDCEPNTPLLLPAVSVRDWVSVMRKSVGQIPCFVYLNSIYMNLYFLYLLTH